MNPVTFLIMHWRGHQQPCPLQRMGVFLTEPVFHADSPILVSLRTEPSAEQRMGTMSFHLIMQLQTNSIMRWRGHQRLSPLSGICLSPMRTVQCAECLRQAPLGPVRTVAIAELPMVLVIQNHLQTNFLVMRRRGHQQLRPRGTLDVTTACREHRMLRQLA